MFFRMRFGLVVALMVTLTTFTTVFAKGSFSFIAIKSPALKEVVRATDPALTADFFAFADFSQSAVEAPVEPGSGYEVIRYYREGNGETPFDELHYYPDTGFVYYDGIAKNGWSEYDGKWYAAKPEIREAFEKALPEYARSAAPAAPGQPAPFLAQNQSVMLIAALAGLILILLFASRFRRPVTR